MKKIVLVIFTAILLPANMLLLSGCSIINDFFQSESSRQNRQDQTSEGYDDTDAETPNVNTGTSGANLFGSSAVDGDSIKDASDLFSSKDFEADYDENKSVLIKLEGNTATSSSEKVVIFENTVTINDEGTYILSGTFDDGMIIVDAEKKDKVHLVLNNVSVHSSASSPIYIRQADKVFITVASDTVNVLSNGGAFAALDENNIDAVIFSKEDLTLNGSGRLVISSPAGHGIVSKEELVLTGGIYEINSLYHGLSGEDSICIANAEVSITAGKDGIHAENEDDDSPDFIYIQTGTFHITSEGNGISASGQMLIDGGSFDMVCGEEKNDDNSRNVDKSAKGIRADGNLIINGGSFNIASSDDAVHSDVSVIVGGGLFEIATGDDGFHADDIIRIYSADINITESYEGLEGLHVEVSGGNITLYAKDDGINAAGGNDRSGFGGRGNDNFAGDDEENPQEGSIVISGGELHIKAEGDGIDANGTLSITGGRTLVCCTNKGYTSVLDFDKSGIITGGTFIGTGTSRMARGFSRSKQGVVTAKTDMQAAGTAITLKDRDDNTVISEYVPEFDFSFVILSSPDIVSGNAYVLDVGSSAEEIIAD